MLFQKNDTVLFIGELMKMAARYVNEVIVDAWKSRLGCAPALADGRLRACKNRDAEVPR